jgi:putative acetyltransferase
VTWTIRDVDADEREALVGIWRRAVEATHDFLAPGEIDELEPFSRVELARAAVRVAVDDDGPVGFLTGAGGAVDALFVDPAVHGRGVGTALLDDAAAHHAVLTVDVNEENAAARAWYGRRGFVEIGRSETDDEGRPHPLLHLRRVTPPHPGPDRAFQNDRRRDPREGARDPVRNPGAM